MLQLLLGGGREPERGAHHLAPPTPANAEGDAALAPRPVLLTAAARLPAAGVAAVAGPLGGQLGQALRQLGQALRRAGDMLVDPPLALLLVLPRVACTADERECGLRDFRGSWTRV